MEKVEADERKMFAEAMHIRIRRRLSRLVGNDLLEYGDDVTQALASTRSRNEMRLERLRIRAGPSNFADFFEQMGRGCGDCSDRDTDTVDAFAETVPTQRFPGIDDNFPEI